MNLAQGQKQAFMVGTIKCAPFTEIGTQHFHLKVDNERTEVIELHVGGYNPVKFDREFLDELEELIILARRLFTR